MSNLIELNFKIVLIGDQDVGKTQFLLKYTDDYFPETHVASIGVEYKTKTLIKGKYKITLNIWDTAGQEHFKSITKSFFNNAAGIIFIYDINKRSTFSGPTGIKNWIKDAEEYGNFECAICGNLIGSEKYRQVPFSDLKELAIKKNFGCFETCPKTGKNINEAFDYLVEKIIKNRTEDELVKEFGIKEGKKSKTLSKKNINHKKNC